MSLSRTFAASIRRSFARPTAAFSPQQRLLPLTAHRHAGDYGSGAGDPKGESPQEQGANPSADKEHPGPPPPSAGQGTGGGPTKGTSDGHNTEASHQGGGKSDSGSGGSSSSSSSKTGAQPKIQADSPPEGQAADVEQHNKEFEQRAEKAHEKVDDGDQKVDKKFWAGTGGVDKDP